MFRYVLSLTFALGCAAAATISTTATCDSVTTVGAFSAHCNDGHFEADAVLGAPPFVDTPIAQNITNFSVFVGVSAGLVFPPGSGATTATFDDDYAFTVYGGTGEGFFLPCLVAAPTQGRR